MHIAIAANGFNVWKFAEAFEAQSGKVTDAAKPLFDKFVYDSEVEHKFAERLENRHDVELHIRPPRWFQVQTAIDLRCCRTAE